MMNTVSFSHLNRHGRLGNQMFQIAATIGIALDNGCNYTFPEWEHEDCFMHPLSHIEALEPRLLREQGFTYNKDLKPYVGQNTDLYGYFQSERYWKNNIPVIRKQFRFKAEYIAEAGQEIYHAFTKETISIHIRRGDYVNNPGYYQLPIGWFINALISIKHWRDCNVIIFSDDIQYCKVHFECLPNVYFSEGKTAMQDLCLMSQCDNHIISNSTLAWWGAYLSKQKNVIRPYEYFAGALSKNSTKDFWPVDWKRSAQEVVDLTDVTFTIPVFADSKDRFQNVNLCLCMLQRSFETNIIIGEQGIRFEYCKEFCTYISYSNGNFHRTKMLNDMAKVSTTPYIANWDCDIIIPPMQVYLTVLALREGADMVFPYDGRFARWERIPWFKAIEKSLDIGIIAGTQPVGNRGKSIDGQTSVGGAVFFNRESFIQGGMENEHMISFGPEDCERNDRFTTLGFKIKRVKGYLHHINHYCGPNSSTKNPYFRANHVEIEKIRKMNKEQLQQYINTWPWLK